MSAKKPIGEKVKTISFSIPPELLLRVNERVAKQDTRSRVICDLIAAGLISK